MAPGCSPAKSSLGWSPNLQSSRQAGRVGNTPGGFQLLERSAARCKAEPALQKLEAEQGVDWERMKKIHAELQEARKRDLASPYGYGFGYGPQPNEEAVKVLWNSFEELEKVEPLVEYTIVKDRSYYKYSHPAPYYPGWYYW